MTPRQTIHQRKTGWNAIYAHPKAYSYYDLAQPHQDLQKIADLLVKNRVRKILDLGCGLGRNLLPLLQKGFIVVGIDDSKQGITTLRKMLEQEGLQAKLVVGKFQHVPFRPQTFDAVISIQTLNHGYEKDVRKGIREVERVLKPGGYFFLTLPGRISKGKVRYCLVKTARKVEPHTYIPTIGEEAGVPHYMFTKALIQRHLQHFSILSLWKDEKDYYCVLARKPADHGRRRIINFLPSSWFDFC